MRRIEYRQFPRALPFEQPQLACEPIGGKTERVRQLNTTLPTSMLQACDSADRRSKIPGNQLMESLTPPKDAGAPDRSQIVRAALRHAQMLADAKLPSGSEHHDLVRPANQALPLPTWTDQDEAQDWFIRLMDDFATAIDTALDRHHKGDIVQQIPTSTPASIPGVKTPSKSQLIRQGANITKPQVLFEPPVDNSDKPFTHWAPHLETLVANSSSPNDSQDKTGHPLQYLLGNLEYPSSQLEAPEPIAPRDLSEPVHWVDTPAALQEMTNQLQGATHIALDLENHSYRSFQGFTCIMQLSTRDCDWVVDCLALRGELGPALAGIMANPNIVKVVHGSDHDVVWLQRDYHIYLVNLFDTGQAARVLGLPSAGLAYLLEHYCNVQSDKRYQLADWRVRPLTLEMLNYARCDTHYLLYIYDRLKQQLMELGTQVPPSLAAPIPDDTPPQCVALMTVLERSRAICQSLYQKEIVTPESCKELPLKWETGLSPMQAAVFTSLMLWRDRVARQEDEGTGYLLPKAQLIALAKNMPSTVKDALRHVGNNASDLLKSRIQEVVNLINTSKESVLTQAVQLTDMTAAAVASATESAAGEMSGPDSSKTGKGVSVILSVTPSNIPAAPVRPAAVQQIKRKVGMMGGGAPPSKRPQLQQLQPSTTQQEQQQAMTVPQTMSTLEQVQQQQTTQQQTLPAGSQQVQQSVAQGVATTSLSDAQPVSLQQVASVTQAVGAQRNVGSKASAFAAVLRVPKTAVQTSTVSYATSETLDPSAAAQTAKQLLASLTLPFAKAPTPLANNQPKADNSQAEQNKAAAENNGTAKQSQTTGSDIRSLVDSLQACGPQPDIMINTNGQETTTPADHDTHAQAAASNGQHQQQSSADDHQQESVAAGYKGEEVGLESLEFVPMSLKELKKQERRNARQAAEQASQQQRQTKKQRYTTELEQQNQTAGDAAAAAAAAKQEKTIAKLFGEDDGSEDGESGTDMDEEDQQMLKDASIAPQEGPNTQLVKTLTKPIQNPNAQQNNRGRGRGAGRQGMSGGRGNMNKGGRGDRKPAFNPYDIPEEHMIKAGKRTTAMPRSGNRSYTFK